MIHQIIRFMVFSKNREKILTKRGFKHNNQYNQCEPKLFYDKSTARNYLKDIYSLNEADYELVRVKITYDEVTNE